MTTEIGRMQNTPVSSSTMPESGVEFGGGIKNSPNAKTAVAQAKGLTEQAVRRDASASVSSASAGPAGKPELVRPQSLPNAAQYTQVDKLLDQVRAMLPMLPGIFAVETEIKTEAAAAAAPGADANRIEESFADKFDITKMSSLPAADLLMMVSFLLRVLGIANTAFEGKMAMIASNAAHLNSDSIKTEGTQKMGTSIAQGAALFASAGAGAGLKMVGFKKQSNDLARNGKAMEAGNARTHGATDALAAAKGKLNVAGEAADIKVTPKNGAPEQTVGVAPSNTTPTDTDRATIANPPKQANTIETDALAEASAANKKQADNYIAAGDAVTGLGTAANHMVGGGGHVMAANEESLQKIIDVLVRASTQSSDNSREQARAAVALIIEMLHAMLDALKSRAATVSTIAGGIRS